MREVANRAGAGKIVLYEDAEIVVYHLPGPTGRLVVTFGDLVGCEDVSTFFGQTMFAKYGVAAIGLVARRPNWYPRHSVLAAYEAIGAISCRYKQVVVYGGSMGGYAAVKYSALLGADIVLSLCPQFTANPSDMVPYDVALSKYYQDSFSDTRIRKEDVRGTVAVLVDHHDRQDMLHAAAIARVSDAVSLYNVPFVGHHVTPVLAGGRMFAALVEAAARRDPQLMSTLVRAARRNAPHRVDTVLLQALKRKRLTPARIAVLLWRRHRSPRSFAFLLLYTVWRAARQPLSLLQRLFARGGGAVTTAA